MTNRTPVDPKIAKLVATIEVPAITEFRVKDFYGQGRDRNVITLSLGGRADRNEVSSVTLVDGVQIGGYNGIFGGWYAGSPFKDGVVETDTPAATLYVYEILVPSIPLFRTFGGEYGTVRLGHLWEVVKLQPRGEAGALLTQDAWKNIIIESEGAVVSASWVPRDGGWQFDAFNIWRVDEGPVNGVRIITR